MSTIYTMRGPRQGDGMERWYGWASRDARDEARDAIRSDPAMIDGISPDAIVDIDIDGGVWYPVRGSRALCASLREAARSEA